MNYINIYTFLEDPEKCWQNIKKEEYEFYENSIFNNSGAYF